MQLFWCIIFFVLVLVERGSCHGGVCEDPDTVNAEICETLFRQFEDSLLNNGSNLYKLRKLLYPSTMAPPELVNITYYLRLTTTANESSSSPLELVGILETKMKMTLSYAVESFISPLTPMENDLIETFLDRLDEPLPDLGVLASELRVQDIYCCLPENEKKCDKCNKILD